MNRSRLLALLGAIVLLMAGLSVAYAGYRAQRGPLVPPPDNRPALPVRKPGVNLPAYQRDAYDGEAVRTSIAAAREAGARWVALNPAWYVSDTRSCDLRPHPDRTVSDAGLYALMEDLERMGISVMLKPHVEVLDGSPRREIQPADVVCWFEAYRQMIDHYAAIAAVGRADLFAIGTQLPGLTTPEHAIYWRQIAASVRRQFDGPITYAAESGTDANAEYRRIEWWDAVDFIGINAYFPVAADEAEDDQVFARAWRSYPLADRDANWVEEVHAVSLAFDRHVILTELGYRSVAGAARAPWDTTLQGMPAPELQARLFEAARLAWEREFWLEGVFIWTWSTDPAAGGTEDTGYLVQGKPALDEIRRWFTQQLAE